MTELIRAVNDSLMDDVAANDDGEHLIYFGGVFWCHQN